MSSAASPEPLVDYQQIQSREDFRRLKKTHRGFVFPMTVIFLLWYVAFVVSAAFFPDLMGISVIGNVNLGIVLGLSQFLSTFLITGLYVYFTNRRLDPQSSAIREELEAAGVGLPEDDDKGATR